MPIWGSRDTRSRAGGFVGLRIRRDSGKVRAARASRHAGTPVHGHTAGGAQREAASRAQNSHVRLIERRYKVTGLSLHVRVFHSRVERSKVRSKSNNYNYKKEFHIAPGVKFDRPSTETWDFGTPMHAAAKGGHCSLLVCHEAAMHFPSRKYPVEWLRNVDASGIRWLMLQPRYSSTPIFSDWATPGSREKGSVANATRFDAKFILAHLPNYELRWSSPRISTYIFYAFERRTNADSLV